MNPLTLLPLVPLLALATSSPSQDPATGKPETCPRSRQIDPSQRVDPSRPADRSPLTDPSPGGGQGPESPRSSGTPETADTIDPVGTPWIPTPPVPTLEEQLQRLPFLLEPEINIPHLQVTPLPLSIPEHLWIPTVFPDGAPENSLGSPSPAIDFEDLLRQFELSQQGQGTDSARIPHIDPDVESLPYIELESPQPIIPGLSLNAGPQNGLEAERRRNQEAFERDYLGEKEFLMARHPGEWVAIVDGHVLPVDPYGHIDPTPSLDALLAQLALTHPDAEHRFIFRVGEEGRVNYHFTMYNESGFVGWSFLMMLEGGVWTSSQGVYITPEKGMPLSTGKPIGPAGQGTMTARLAGPDGHGERDLPLFIATAYGGSVVLDEADAASFRLELWEIPGVAFSEGRGEMRRARVRVEVPGADFEGDVPVSIWTR